MSNNEDTEPNTARESGLVTTCSVDDFERMSSSLEEIKNTNSVQQSEETTDNCNADQFDESASFTKESVEDGEIEDNREWTSKSKHIFVLSQAGKPIYSRYGNEDKLAWIFGVMQTLVSFVQSSDDTIKSIHAGDTHFVFLIKKPLILVAVSKTQDSSQQIITQLNYVFNQIVSILTLTRLNKIYEQRQNYDLRRLLTGVERLIDHLLDFSETDPSFILSAVQCLPLTSSVRDTISSSIITSCNKIKNLVFAILLADNKLITLVRMKKYCLHPADLHLIFNLVQASESLRNSESWTPLCLPRFDASGFLYGHVSYLAEDCQACLLLLTVERDVFFTLSDAKQRIVEKLRRGNCLEAINEAIVSSNANWNGAEFPELRHYLYKCKSTAHFYQPPIQPPYSLNHRTLIDIYKRLHQQLHSPQRHLKLAFERSSNEAVLAWDTKGFELYAVFEPLTTTALVIATISRLLDWVKKREDKLFCLNAPTF